MIDKGLAACLAGLQSFDISSVSCDSIQNILYEIKIFFM